MIGVDVTVRTMDSDTAEEKSVAILLAPGFSEEDVATCAGRLRHEGFRVWLISTAVGLVAGEHGLLLRPDLRLSQSAEIETPAVVVLPGGTRCTRALAVLPSVHELIQATLDAGGQVALLRDADAALKAMRLAHNWPPSQVLRQHGRSPAEFADRLLDYLLA